MKRLAAVVLAAVTTLLSGCATYDNYAYHDDAYYQDDRYDDYYYRNDRDRFYNDRAAYSLSYGSAAYRYPTYGGYGYGNGPDYLVYNSYYSSLWPVYRYYYDPFWSPGFYYGVTFFPRTYFGLNVGWYSWPYYHSYSPYRYSYADHYYDWWDNSHGRPGRWQGGQSHGDWPRYGSARNEAQSLASRSGARGAANAYYGASSQPGGIVDPIQARTAHGRGQVLPFERSGRDWNTQPYGRDGRGYRGFAEGATPAGGGGARGQLDRGGRADARSAQPYDPSQPVQRNPRGYGRDGGYAAPEPQMRGRDYNGRTSIRDERAFDDNDRSNGSASGRPYSRGRTMEPDASNGGFLPRQTRDPHDPMFERHSVDDSESRNVRQYEPRSREAYRGQPVQQRQSFQSNESMDRGFARPEPRFERSEPRYERQAPSFERNEPRYEQRQVQSYQRSEPRSEPSYQRSEPTYQRSEPRNEPRSAPSYSAPSGRSDSGGGRGSSSSDSDSGGRGSARGQLEGIVRDDD